MSFDSEPEIAEARRCIDRATGGLATLHLGPLDYNIATTLDALRGAMGLIEQFGQDRAAIAKATSGEGR